MSSPFHMLAAQPAVDAAILSRCTLVPWIVTIHYVVHEWRRDGGAAPIFKKHTTVVQGLLSDRPSGLSFVPQGAEFHKSDVFPATRFDDMKPEQRERYRTQYRAFLMWRKAHALGMKVEELRPWVDYDATFIDETVARWVKPTGRYAGD